MHVNTRVKAKVDAIPGAELRCNVCESWKPTSEFGSEKERPNQCHKASYGSRCTSCNRLYAKVEATLREGGKRVYPTCDQVREALGKPFTPTPALKQANHTKGHVQPRKAKPMSTALRNELRERREEKEGVPSMCYLVGMEGNNSAVKIGHSTNVYRRMAQYQAGNPHKLKVIALLPGGEVKERELHRKHIKEHLDWMTGEWFAKTPGIMNEFSGGLV